MADQPAVIVLQDGDSVAVAVYALEPEDRIGLGDVTIRDRIPAGHKLALRDIEQGEDVLKYGEIIGQATVPIPKGTHVHVHNLVGKRLIGT